MSWAIIRDIHKEKEPGIVITSINLENWENLDGFDILSDDEGRKLFKDQKEANDWILYFFPEEWIDKKVLSWKGLPRLCYWQR